VAGCTERVIYVYEKEENGMLKKVEKIEIGTGPDNIDFDEEGNLLVACHPQLLKFVAHAKDAKEYSPSHVLKIAFKAPNDFNIEEIFLNDGTTYSGSSIAVNYGNTLLIGSVFEPSLLFCTLKK
jgi:arylesterase/paraoxonase